MIIPDFKMEVYDKYAKKDYIAVSQFINGIFSCNSFIGTAETGGKVKEEGTG